MYHSGSPREVIFGLESREVRQEKLNGSTKYPGIRTVSGLSGGGRLWIRIKSEVEGTGGTLWQCLIRILKLWEI